MKYMYDTEDYNSPELLEQDELDRDMKFFEDLEVEIMTARLLYKHEMEQK